MDFGFREYVRNPELRDEWARQDELAEQLGEKPAEELVSLLLDEDQCAIAAEAIEQANPAIVPHLVAALSDPRFHRKVEHPAKDEDEEPSDRSYPLVAVLECLEKFAPESAVSEAAKLVDHEDNDVRKNAASLLGAIGTDSTIPLLLRCLQDKDEYVRSYAVMGIQRALEDDRGSGRFREALFDAVMPLVFSDDNPEMDDSAVCLLQLDRQRTIEVLTAPERLTARTQGLHRSLGALRQAEVPLEESLLTNLVTSLSISEPGYPEEYALAEAVRLLALCDTDTARVTIASRMQSNSKHVRHAAAEAMLEFQGIREPYDFAFNRLNGLGWAALTIVQREVLATRIFIDEVNNGGFAQYFVNDSGDHWSDALEGLKAIGAARDRELLQKAVCMFGKKTPSTNTEKRHKQLAAIMQDDFEIFEDLEEEFYEDKQDREIQLLRFIASCPEDFTDAPPHGDS